MNIKSNNWRTSMKSRFRIYRRVLNKVYELGDEDTKALIDEVWAEYVKEEE